MVKGASGSSSTNYGGGDTGCGSNKNPRALFLAVTARAASTRVTVA